MLRTLTAMATFLVVASCKGPVGAESDIARVRLSFGAIIVENVSDAPVYYFAVDQNTLPLLDWIACSDPPRCNGVPARATRRIPLDEVVWSGTQSATLVVYHWHLVSGGGPTGFVPDRIREGRLVMR